MTHSFIHIFFFILAYVLHTNTSFDSHFSGILSLFCFAIFIDSLALVLAFFGGLTPRGLNNRKTFTNSTTCFIHTYAHAPFFQQQHPHRSNRVNTTRVGRARPPFRFVCPTDLSKDVSLGISCLFLFVFFV